MSESTHTIRLAPIGTEIAAPSGTAIKGLLFEHGVEFPCGGSGRCRGCKIRIVEGQSPPCAAEVEHLSKDEIDDGWRLACQTQVTGDIRIELRQWDASILANDSGFAFTPQVGLGVAVDLGTTTLVAQLLDLSTGHVLAVRTGLNSQASFGADVMSRVEFAVSQDGAPTLREAIRSDIGRLIRQALALERVHAAADISKVVIVGNTVMHHLFCSIDCLPLSQFPFEPHNDGLQVFAANDLGWSFLPESTQVFFLPCLGGFVGSDILAGILATGLDQSYDRNCLLDLGTNGEIVIGNRDKLLCASTAAGPAFEGARISMGMRASTGAIWRVTADHGNLRCEVLGDVAPRGLCGSGLVDAVASGLEIGAIAGSGRLCPSGCDLVLADPVVLTQTDIRQLQLAKGAIAAGVRILLKQSRLETQDISKVMLAGAFGNYIDRDSAHRIGLLVFKHDLVSAAGNSALLGAKIALCTGDQDYAFESLRRRVQHVSLSADSEFQDIYVDEMSFA